MRQELPARPAPLGWLSAVRPHYRKEALRRVQSFAKKMTKWLAAESERPQIVVIPRSWLEHWVHEAPHDFYSQPGKAIPMDLSQASPSHMNLDFYLHQGKTYPDQELLSFIILGVRYKADLPVQIVLQPHLQPPSADRTSICKSLIVSSVEGGQWFGCLYLLSRISVQRVALSVDLWSQIDHAAPMMREHLGRRCMMMMECVLCL